jgi:hypothetical protein
MGMKQGVSNQRKAEAHAYADAIRKLVESRRSEDMPEESSGAWPDAGEDRRTETPALLRPKQTKSGAALPPGYNPYFDLPPE